MLDPDQFKAVTKIITHDNCADGMACAILAHDALPWAKIEFVQYSTDLHKTLPAEPGLLFADFSPAPDRVAEFVDAGAIVLDHHKTAKPVVDAFGSRGIFGDEKTQPGICGASLVYEHVWKPLRGQLSTHTEFVERFARYAGIVDTWQRQHPEWEQARVQQSALTFPTPEFWLAMSLHEIAASWDDRFKWIGATRIHSQDKRSEKCIQEGHRFTSPSGTRVVLFEGVSHTSYAAEILDTQVDLVVGFSYRVEDGKRILIFSTRSHTTFDCSAFARSHGGGGHTKAAGFSLRLSEGDPNPYSMFEHILFAYEAGRGRVESSV